MGFVKEKTSRYRIPFEFCSLPAARYSHVWIALLLTSKLDSFFRRLISWFFFSASIRYLAEWMVNGYPSENVWPLDLKRFGTLQSSRTFLRHRVMEVMRKWGLCLHSLPGHATICSLLHCLSSVSCHCSENHFPSCWPPLGQMQGCVLQRKGMVVALCYQHSH